MKVSSPRTSRSARRRMVAGAGALALGAGVLVTGVLAPAAQAAGAVTIKDLVLGVGANETQRYVTWYASAGTDSTVQLEKTAELNAGAFDEDVMSYPATVTATTGTSGGDIARSPYRGSALLDTLEANTSYTYQVLASDGSTSSTYTFKTGAFGLGSGFEFAAFGDPQIGADSNNNSQSTSADLREDAAGWADTLSVLQADAGDDALPLELLTSTGDQIETANVESQWDAWFTPDQLRTLPYAAAIGNHDSSDLGYKYHFSLPNNDTTTANLQTTAGGDYWYVYKGVLFVVINSNAQSSVKDPAHMAFVTQAVKANPGAKWRVVSYHHALYSPASHANDGDAVARRQPYTQAFSELGINLVLQGHDHSYSRSYVLQNKGAGADRQNAAEAQAANNVLEGPGGVIYVTTNSASGSKYYNLTEPIAGTSDATHGGKYPAGTMPNAPTAGGTHTLHWANSVENQDYVRTYLKVAVTADKLAVTNVVAGVCDYPNKYTTQHVGQWCGATQTTTTLADKNGNGTFDRNKPSSGAPATPSNADADKYTTTTGVAPVGTAQDTVNITKWDGTQGDGQLLALDVPPSNPGELGWFINGGNHLVNLGTANRHGNYFTATGTVDPLSITDSRTFGDTSWSLNAQVSDLKDGSATLAAKYVGWVPKIVVAGGGANAGAAVANGYSGGTGLRTSRTLATAGNGHAPGTAQVGADLNLKFPVSVSGDAAHNFWGEITYTLL
ncbi:MAG: metallophosphoesterase family protein [Nocardioidaceae bacterium]|nr:metallophosphoesterase family protein [Nocardioidaceae bacterium]